MFKYLIISTKNFLTPTKNPKPHSCRYTPLANHIHRYITAETTEFKEVLRRLLSLPSNNKITSAVFLNLCSQNVPPNHQRFHFLCLNLIPYTPYFLNNELQIMRKTIIFQIK